MSNQHQISNRRPLVPVLVLLASAISLAACTTTDGAELGTGETELQSTSLCCEGGTYYCSATGYEVDYWVPKGPCIGLTKPRAQTKCAAACGAPCVDTGWEWTCF